MVGVGVSVLFLSSGWPESEASDNPASARRRTANAPVPGSSSAWSGAPALQRFGGGEIALHGIGLYAPHRLCGEKNLPAGCFGKLPQSGRRVDCAEIEMVARVVCRMGRNCQPHSRDENADHSEGGLRDFLRRDHR